jgi:hypothetical protein
MLTDGNFRQVTGTPPHPQAWDMVSKLYMEIAYYTGLDLTSSAQTSNSKTAYQEAVRQEMASQFVLHTAENRDIAYTRLYTLHLAMVQKFFPREKVIGLVPLLDNGKPNMAMANIVTTQIKMTGLTQDENGEVTE